MLTVPRILTLLASLVALTTALQGQPGAALQEAVNQLFSAGNYSWRESRQSNFNDRKSAKPYGIGVTVINGFTLATVMEPHNLRAAFHGPRTAFEIKDGWRRTLDFTEDEIIYVFGVSASMLELRPSMGEMYRKYSHALFHDVLRLMLQAATNLREENGAIVGNVADWDLEMFVRTGRPPRAPPPNLFGRPPLRRPSLPGTKEESGVFHVWIADGMISKCTIDFSRSAVIQRGEYAGKEFSTQTVHTYEITNIGSTKVDIGSDIAAVFNDVVKIR